MTVTTPLSERAAGAAASLPPLLAEAERLAASIWGVHGRRSAGTGETFWQYRHALPGDSLGSIDWRRSARSDDLYVRETEWESAQSVWFWPDASAAMRYSSGDATESKADRAALIALALASLLERGGERFALMQDHGARPMRGRSGLNRMALALEHDQEPRSDYGAPPEAAFQTGARAVFLSDFFGDLKAVESALKRAAARRVRGFLVQVNDPSEEAFPYEGRVLFESMGGGLRYDADRADMLREPYKRALARRRDALRDAARAAGWRFLTHRTDAPVAPVLLTLHAGLEGARRMGAR